MNEFFGDLRAYLPILISGAAFALSVVSLLLNRRYWHQSNRPVVTAFVAECGPLNKTGTFNLVITNTGNRPAVNIQLHAKSSDISRLFEDGADSKRLDHVAQCFMPESKIPLLRNGEELTTAFGAVSMDPGNGKWLKYGVEINISITYADLKGRRYKEKVPLKIYAREGFGGSSWV